MKRPFLTAEWKNLIMANYTVEPLLLEPFLPYATEIDMYNGKAYVSLVGFMFENTRLLGFRVPFHINFPEVNLRFYVKHNDNGNWKRGVVFIKEIVPKLAIKIIANSLYNEKYACMLMRNQLLTSETKLDVGYSWKYRGSWNSLQVNASLTAQPMVADSEHQFIAEHYWGYSKYNHNVTYEYEVTHPAWRVHDVADHKIDCAFEQLYGKSFSLLQGKEPDSVFLAAGSAITVSNKRILRR